MISRIIGTVPYVPYVRDESSNVQTKGQGTGLGISRSAQSITVPSTDVKVKSC